MQGIVAQGTIKSTAIGGSGLEVSMDVMLSLSKFKLQIVSV